MTAASGSPNPFESKMVGRCLKLLIKVRVAEFQQQQGIEVEMVMRVVTNDLSKRLEKFQDEPHWLPDEMQ